MMEEKIFQKTIVNENLKFIKKVEGGISSEKNGLFYFDHIPSQVNLSIADNTLELSSKNKSMFGTALSLLNNRLKGFENPFKLEIELKGKGYSATKQGDKIKFIVGYSHDVNFQLIPGVDINILGSRKLILTSIDKRLLGQVGAEIIKIKKPNLYFECGFYTKDIVMRKRSRK